jgi:hypothetical protein
VAGGSRPEDRAAGPRSREAARKTSEKTSGKAPEKTRQKVDGKVEGKVDDEPVQGASLHAVSGDAERSALPPPPKSQEPLGGPKNPRRSPASGVGPVAALAAALVLASLLLAYQQYQRASELGTEVEGLRSALETVRGELGSYRERMTLVKGHIDDLSARVGALAELVDDDGVPVSGFGSEAEAPSE